MSTNEALSLKNKQDLHHAYLLIGGKDCWREVLEQKLKSILGVKELSSSPDVWWRGYDSFGIKDSHNLIEREARRSFGGQGRFFILEIASITPEAQNALLKTLEEPAADVHFFIIARSAEMFLPTLRSRLFILTKEGEGETEKTSEKFLKLDLSERLDFIQKEFLKSKDKGASKGEIIDFINDLEKILHKKIKMAKISKDEELIFRELEKSRRYLENPRSSNRLILEHLALILP